MQTQQALSKLKADLLKTVNEAEQAAEEAERRKVIARSEADNLENRNRLAVEAMHADISTQRKANLGLLHAEILKEKTAISELTASKKKLAQAVDKKTIELDRLDEQGHAAQQEIETLKAVLTNLRAELSFHQEELISLKNAISGKTEQAETIQQQVNDLNVQRLEVEADLDNLSGHADALENQLIDQDAVFKEQAESYASRLKEAGKKLEATQASLDEAMAKDKQVRRAWAEEHLNLEKREQNVKGLERHVSGLQERANELTNYLKL